MKVLMVGATGRFASQVIPQLKQRGVTIRALVRSKAKIDVARQQGADEAVVGDLNDADSLRVAASGMEGVFHLNPAFAPNEAELGVAMVEAAKVAGVRKFVFSSVIHLSMLMQSRPMTRNGQQNTTQSLMQVFQIKSAMRLHLLCRPMRMFLKWRMLESMW